MNQTLRIQILSPKETIFDSQALSISSKNSLGKFDILPQHANFITLVQKNPIIIVLPQKRVIRFNFPMAIIYTKQNIVKIYTDINF